MKVRIFCLRTMSWWKPNAQGYMPNPQEAGLFDCEDALNMSRDSFMCAFPTHAIVPLPWSEVEGATGAQTKVSVI